MNEGNPALTDKPVELDERRDRAARKATGIRRQRLQLLQMDQAASQRREAEIETLFQAPAQTWSEAAAKARYLIGLYAATPEAREAKREKLIAQALGDLARLSDGSAEPS